MMKKQKIMLYRIIAAAVIYVPLLYWNIWKTGISVRNSGAVFVIYDTLFDRGMGHHLPGCAQYQSWSGI
ncbi:MAG: hypothetical protein ACLR2O_15485 [Coprococcus sp.]